MYPRIPMLSSADARACRLTDTQEAMWSSKCRSISSLFCR
jgi:hypothetical protein